MRRILGILVIALALSAAVLATSASSQDGTDDGGAYLVRAVFDNGGFIVTDEDVRIAGAIVGNVESTDVSRPGEVVSLEPSPTAIPGKAIVVLNITDGGFQDFREDAECLIRPQSLIGEKYVECKPTQPRAPGTEPPPPLEQIPDGEPGEGQYLLPLERNGKAVDIDLINNINSQPFAERFRLILNDLGASLAGRGDELREIVRKANPALRETDKVLKILADQNQLLARLAVDSDTSLAPLARERASLVGFIQSAGESAEATAEKGAELEENLAKLPPTLREVRLTMNELGGFSDAAYPVFKVLGDNAPTITAATRQLGPFMDATTIALRSLGDASEEAGPDLAASDPVVVQVRNLAKAAARPATNLNRLTSSLRATGGFEQLMGFILNTAATYNGFDQYGHYQRTNILVSGCIQYQTFPQSGCVANFTGPGTAFPDGRIDPWTRRGILEAFPRLPSQSGGASPGDGNLPLSEALQAEPAPSEGVAPAEPPEEALQSGIGVLDYLLGP